jgi:hypothetical protein
MPELPTAEWEVENYLEWMKRGFDYLHFQWVEQVQEEEGEPPPWLEVCRPEFLDTLETNENEIISEPRLRVLSLFVYHVDEGFSDEAERREILLDEDQVGVILQTCIDTWRGEVTDAAPPDVLEGLSWLPAQEQGQLQALGDDWPDKLRAFLDEHYEGWRGSTEELVGQFVTAWMGEILGSIPVAPPPPDALEGLSWLPAQEQGQLQALGDDWPDKLRAFLDEHYEGWRGSTEELVGQFVTAWMGEILGSIPVAPPPPAGDEDSPSDIARQALSELNAMVAEERDDLTGQASPEELQQLLAELLEEGLAARAG